ILRIKKENNTYNHNLEILKRYNLNNSVSSITERIVYLDKRLLLQDDLVKSEQAKIIKEKMSRAKVELDNLETVEMVNIIPQRLASELEVQLESMIEEKASVMKLLEQLIIAQTSMKCPSCNIDLLLRDQRLEIFQTDTFDAI